MSAISNNTNYSSGKLQRIFSDQYPFSDNWLDGLTEDIKAIARIARQTLIDGNHNEKELADASLQLAEWRKKSLFIAVHVPSASEKEKLGCMLDIGKLIEFLMAHEEINGFKHYEFVALALLHEIYGLSEVEVIVGRNDIGSNTQYLALRIAQLHIALLFFRTINNLPLEQQRIFKEMAIYLFNSQIPQS